MPILAGLAYLGLVLVLPFVLGRKARRSRKALVGFVLVLLTMTAFGIILITEKGELPTDPPPSIHDIEDHAVGKLVAPYLAGSLFLGVLVGLIGCAIRSPEPISRQNPGDHSPV